MFSLKRRQILFEHNRTAEWAEAQADIAAAAATTTDEAPVALTAANAYQYETRDLAHAESFPTPFGTYEKSPRPLTAATTTTRYSGGSLAIPMATIWTFFRT
jgi:hypothetical protein